MAKPKIYKSGANHSLIQRLMDRSLMEKVSIAYVILVLCIVCTFYLCATFSILPHDPEEIALNQVLTPPFSSGYILGTDYLGRDTLTRLILGTEAYFLPGLFAVSIAIAIGGILGAVTVYSNKKTKKLINLFSNCLQSMPRLVVLFLFIAIFEPNIYLIMLIVGVSHIPSVAKLINNRVNTLKEKNFIDSAIASGLPTHTIIFKHILWFNCRAILIAQASLIMSEAILMETSLSYLGFGVQEPTSSWGNMIQSGANYLMQGQIWSSSIPAIAVMLVLSALFLLSNLFIHRLDRL